MARRREQRANIEDPKVPVSAANFAEFFGLGAAWGSAAGVTVTIDSALGVPAVWGAVNFLSSTLAGLPLHVYRRGKDGHERVGSGDLARLMEEAANDETPVYEWRKLLWMQVFTGGRAFTFIERGPNGKPRDLWYLDPTKVTVRRVDGRKQYEYREGGRTVVYGASDIIDVPFALKADGIGHRGPIMSNRDTIGRAIATTQYASKFFQHGGVPPFAVVGKFVTTPAMQRAADDLASAVKKAAKEQRQALVLPEGLDIKPIGADPEKSQLVEADRFLIEQIARIYSLPPLFLQDLTRLSYSNSEQQDLHLVKHTVAHWCEQFEQELNLKLFGRTSSVQFVEHVLDGIMRGDFKARMEGYAQAIQTGQMKPNEVRRLENRPPAEGGDQLFMQGAMVPITRAGAQLPLPLAGNDPQGGDGNA